MSKRLSKLLKNNEKASITLFVLISVLFFLITVSYVFYASNNTRISQMKQVERIQSEYNPTFEEMQKQYEQATK